MSESAHRLTKSETVKLGRLALRDQALELQSKGYSITAIAEKLGIAESSVRHHLKIEGPQDV